MKLPFSNDNNIDDLFRKELKEHQAAPPKGVWDEINAQLPIKRNPLPLYVAVSVFIAALMVAGWWSIDSLSLNNRYRTTKGASNFKETHINALTAISKNTSSHSIIANLHQVTTHSNNSKTISTLSPSIQEQTNANTLAVVSIKTNLPAYLTNESIIPANLLPEPVDMLQNMPGKQIADIQQPNVDNISYSDIGQRQNVPAPVTLNDRKIKGFYAGINGSVNNVWILDHAALHNNNFDYQITPGFAYGIQEGYNFSNNFGIEAGINLNSRKGQDYTVYINSIIPVNKSVVLNYTEIPIMAKFKIPQISAFTGMPVVLNINAGVSYGYLRSAYTFVEGDKTGSQDQYPTNEVNALMGFSYDLYTNHPYSFSFGVMGEYGINTTNNNTQGVTASSVSSYANGSDFSKPHNFSIGINLAINYNFSLFHR